MDAGAASDRSREDDRRLTSYGLDQIAIPVTIVKLITRRFLDSEKPPLPSLLAGQVTVSIGLLGFVTQTFKITLTITLIRPE